MAFDLRARLRLDDRMSDPLRRIQRQAERNQRTIDQLNRSTSQLDRANQRWRDSNGRLRDGLGRFARQVESSSRSVNRFRGELGRGFGAGIRGLSSLTATIGGVAAAFGGAVAAKKIFDNTIGEAAKYEQSSVVIEAMFRNRKKASKYMSEMNKLAIDSPLLNSQDIFANSKSFIAFSQSIPTLKKMFRLAERFVALDPFQGVEGAVFSMKELFSGDAFSIQRRFEIGTKAEWNAIKKLPVKEQIGAIDKLLNKYRITDDLIKKMGNTTLGIWNQIKEKTQVIMRDMGKPALKVIKKFIDEINNGMSGDKLSGFQKTGADILKNMTQGFINAVKGIGSWISYIQNSPKFKNGDLFMKVSFVFEDIGKRFKKWLKDGGQDKLNTAAKNIIEITSAAFLANQEIIITSIKSIGTAIGSALVSSTTESMMKSFNNSAIAKYFPLATWMKWIANGGNYVREKIFGSGSGNKKKSNGTGNGSSSAGKFGPKPTSHASGLTRVPYNGYQATLHKNERILTPEEAKEYNAGRGGSGGNTYQITVNVNGQLTDRRTVDKLLAAMVSKIQLAGGAGA